MPVEISVSSDIKALEKKLTKIQKKQIPFAAMLALNEIAFQSRKAEQNALRNYIDSPTRFTQSGYQVNKAKKKSLKATLFIPGNRGYMQYPIEGKPERRAAKRHAIPVNKALQGKYGHMPRNKARTLLKRKNHFSATINGTSGIWKREPSGGLSLQAVFKDEIRHTRRYPVWKATQRLINSRFKHVMNDKLNRALKSAR